MDKFSDLLAKRLKQKGLQQSVEASHVLSVANKQASFLTAIKIKHGVLYCQIEGPAQRRQAQQEAHRIIAGINNELGRTIVERIVWQLRRE